MFCDSQVPHSLWEKAIQVACNVGSFMEVVMKNDCLGDKFGIKMVSVLGNEELKVTKIAE